MPDTEGAFEERHPTISEIDPAVIEKRRYSGCCVACGRKLVIAPSGARMCPTDLHQTGHES